MEINMFWQEKCLIRSDAAIIRDREKSAWRQSFFDRSQMFG